MQKFLVLLFFVTLVFSSCLGEVNKDGRHGRSEMTPKYACASLNSSLWSGALWILRPLPDTRNNLSWLPTFWPTANVCCLPLVTGPCKAKFPRWGYDKSVGKCVKFTYGGCDGNANNFEHLEQCRAVCETPWTADPYEQVE